MGSTERVREIYRKDERQRQIAWDVQREYERPRERERKSSR